jgi:hypothetical protein
MGEPVYAFLIYSNGLIVGYMHQAFQYKFTIKPFKNPNGGVVYYSPVLSATYLQLMSSKIRSTYSMYNHFTATMAFTLTWYFHIDLTRSVFYQVVLCTDTHSSFVLVSYVQLDNDPPDQIPDFKDQYENAYIYTYFFFPSTTWSNCGVPGQFIYQFNVYPPSFENRNSH